MTLLLISLWLVSTELHYSDIYSVHH